MKKHPRLSREKGFALVVCLSLMILLTVVAVGLLSLATISLRSSTQNEAMATAKSNARLALMLAIGDLQKSLGPDKAISANSEILSATPSKPNTTGVWESWDFNPNSGSLGYTDEKKNRFRRWLVSAPDPKTAEERDFVNSAWTGQTVELVGKNALGGLDTDADKVRAGKVPLSKNNKKLGAYAWHVSDESQKARINLYRDPSRNGTLAMKRALLAGHRPDVSFIKSPQNSMLDFLPADETPTAFLQAEKDSGKVTGLNQVDLLTSNSRIKPFRNIVTPYSLGVLSNVREGGLKKDLSSIFEMTTTSTSVLLPPEFSSKKLYQSTLGYTGISDPNWSALASYYNTFRSITNPDSKPTFLDRPLEVRTLGNLAPPSRFFPGPVIAKVEVLFGFVVRDAHAPAWGYGGALTKFNPKMKYMGHLLMSPLVTLHNPYNVRISFDTLQVHIRNVPMAFRFYVNGAPQPDKFATVSDMFVDGARGEKSFAMKIGNWTAATSTSTSKAIEMEPGQTLVCGPYIDPSATFDDALRSAAGKDFFDWENKDSGTDKNGNITLAINGRPGFQGKGIGFDVDWITPPHIGGASSNDGGHGVLGLIDDEIVRPGDPVATLPKIRDVLYVESKIQKPAYGMSDRFQVSAKITAKGREFDYGGLEFLYDDNALNKLFPKTYRYPFGTGTFYPADAYHNNQTAINAQNRVKSVALFSAAARTTSGGVYETGFRTETAGAQNILADGVLAGKPMLFHNPARPVMSSDLKIEKPSGLSHELNFQPLPGEVDNVFEVDVTNRGYAVTGNTTKRGIKSGSYLEVPTGPMQTIADFRRSNALSSGYLPAFVQPVSNSYASPIMATDKVIDTDRAVASYPLLDHSVLANHALYDRFYFSTFATVGKTTPDTTFDEFISDKAPLPNQSFEPYIPAGKTKDSGKSELFASGKPKDTAYKSAAEYQMVKGAFNVNSTSVQAWKAALAAMNKGEVATLWARNSELELNKSTKVPILAMSLMNGGVATGVSGAAARIDNSKTNEWNGYRELSDKELEELANRIVEQVRIRGPFLSMSEFVNRQVGSDSDLTRVGALQAAIDQSKINDEVYNAPNYIPIQSGDLTNGNLYYYKTPLAATGNPAAGAPGWISQGDLMRILEPSATVRSDTFVIRVCGEAWDASGRVAAKAYAEAVVQRIPEYLNPVDRPSVNVYLDSTASAENKIFGRKMQIVSFRWLSTNEI